MSDAPERSVDAVLFDLDGTLVDSLATIAEAMAVVLRRHGFDATAEQVVPMIGPPMEVVAQQFGAPAEQAIRIQDDYLALYTAEYVARTPEREGATALLDRLAAAGIALGVVTNKVESSARDVLSAVGWTDRFDVVVGRDTPGAAAKPAPEAAWHALGVLGIAPERAAFVGDTEFDVQCARAAGIRHVIALDAHRDADFLRAEGATHLVHMLREVGDVLLSATRGSEAAS